MSTRKERLAATSTRCPRLLSPPRRRTSTDPRGRRRTLTSRKVATPSRNPPAAAATAAGSGTGAARSIGLGSARTGSGRTSASCWGSGRAAESGTTRRLPRQRSLIHAVLLRDRPAHGLHGPVHRLVRLEDPAHFAPLDAGDLGLVEVLRVQPGGNAGVLVGGLHAEESDPAAVDDPPPAQVVPPAERQQPAVHQLQHLVDVGDRDRDAHRLAVGLLGDHEPVRVEHEVQLLRVGVQVALRVRDEAPVPRPRLVVDLGERVEVASQGAAAHVADADAVLRLELLGEVPDDRHHPVAAGDVEIPHEEIHGLLEPGRLAQLLVVGRVPRLPHHRLAVVALDQNAALVVHREVHRPEHPVAPAVAQPAGRRVQECLERLLVALDLEEAEHPRPALVEVVEGVVDLGARAADDAAVALGQEELRLGVLEEGVEARIQEQPALDPEGWNPGGPVRVQAERQLDELAPVLARPDHSDLHGHGAAPYMPTAIDLFEKARRHERLEQLQAARDQDLLPYFRVLEGPAGPVVEMEGRERIMLGSNNYLGLTGDPRVKEAARDALERFGTGLTGSRFLNGTLSLHLELEGELADWMGTEDALVYTTGYLANTGAIGTLLDPGDTVI